MYLTTSDAAAVLGVSAKSLRDLIRVSGFALLAQPERQGGAWARVGDLDLLRAGIVREVVAWGVPPAAAVRLLAKDLDAFLTVFVGSGMTAAAIVADAAFEVRRHPVSGLTADLLVRDPPRRGCTSSLLIRLDTLAADLHRRAATAGKESAA